MLFISSERQNSPFSTSKSRKSSPDAFTISFTQPRISSHFELMLFAISFFFCSSLYKSFSSAFAYSSITPSGVFMSCDKDSTMVLFCFCRASSAVFCLSSFSRKRSSPQRNFPKYLLLLSFRGAVRFPFASSVGYALIFSNGRMILINRYKSRRRTNAAVIPKQMLKETIAEALSV